MDKGHICVTCGNEFTGRFCSECGAEYKSQMCSNCGAVIEAKFCSECGTKVPNVEIQDTPQDKVLSNDQLTVSLKSEIKSNNNFILSISDSSRENSKEILKGKIEEDFQEPHEDIGSIICARCGEVSNYDPNSSHYKNNYRYYSRNVYCIDCSRLILYEMNYVLPKLPSIEYEVEKDNMSYKKTILSLKTSRNELLNKYGLRFLSLEDMTYEDKIKRKFVPQNGEVFEKFNLGGRVIKLSDTRICWEQIRDLNYKKGPRTIHTLHLRIVEDNELINRRRLAYEKAISLAYGEIETKNILGIDLEIIDHIVYINFSTYENHMSKINLCILMGIVEMKDFQNDYNKWCYSANKDFNLDAA